jgi:hypothetical protein
MFISACRGEIEDNRVLKALQKAEISTESTPHSSTVAISWERTTDEVKAQLRDSEASYSLLSLLSLSENNPSPGQIVRGQFDAHFVSWDDSNEVLSHSTRNVR